MVVLVIVGSAATHWLAKGLAPRMYRRLDPATAGTAGFVIRLLTMSAVVIVALRIAGVNAGALAVGGAFTAVILGLAAQQSLGGIFAGIVLQSTRPFRVGERVRLVGGPLAGSLEGTVSSLGLFYTTLTQGADRLLVPNSVLLQLVVVPLREPERVDLRARFPTDASPQRIERRLLESITVPTRYRPSVSLEEARPRRRRPPDQRHPAAPRGRLAAGRGGAGGAARGGARRGRPRPHLTPPKGPPAPHPPSPANPRLALVAQRATTNAGRGPRSQAGWHLSPSGRQPARAHANGPNPRPLRNATARTLAPRKPPAPRALAYLHMGGVGVSLVRAAS